MLRRRRRVLRAGDDERRGRDLAEPLAEVPRGDGLAARGIRRARRLQEHGPVSLAVAEAWREPAIERHVDERRRSLDRDAPRSLAVRIAAGEACGAASDYEAVDAFRRRGCEPHADGAAERDAAERRPVDVVLVEQLEDVGAELLDARPAAVLVAQ